MGQALWFVSRATGLVTLLLLTATVVLGCAHAGRIGGGRWPRFAVHAVHRNLSLLAAVFVTVHVSCAVIDGFVPLAWVDVVVPFVSSYDPVWVGLGAIAFDLFVAAVVTSLLRARLPHRVWRGVHLATYALWPVAMVHAWGIAGADGRLPWVIVIEAACGAAVCASVARRVLVRHPHAEARSRRAAALR